MHSTSAAARAVPVTVLAGFLGAGKTTLLNHLLSQDHGLHIGVLVNDFGAINIDAQLVETVADDVVNLSNGCICCAIRGDLMDVIWKLLGRPDPPDYLLIEASGVADPSAIAFTLAAAGRHGGIRLDAVVTVVDAGTVLEKRPPEVDELLRDQLRVAHLVILNKTDLVDEKHREAAKQWIEEAAPGAGLLESRFAAVPAAFLLGVEAVSEGSFAEAPAHRHAAFASWSLDTDRPAASLRAITMALKQLPGGVLRVKGVLYVREMPERALVVHRVGTRTDVQPGEAWIGAPRTRLVAIGLPGSIHAERLDAWAEQWLG